MSDILPTEIWTEILVRIPVRSLLSLKCVSKSFLSLIRNPNFTNLHFSRFNNCYSESNEFDLLLLERSASFTVCRGDKFSKTLESTISIDSGYDVVGYVDGLLWLHNFNSPIKHMLLCNPSIRKISLISPSPGSQLGRTDVGFGYDRVSNDYKAVVIVHVETPEYNHQILSPAWVEVYSVKKGSWRSIGVVRGIEDWVLGKSFYANGVVHWLASLANSNGDDRLFYVKISVFSHVVSFDLGTELFSYRELPNLDGVDRDMILKLPLLLHGSFAVLYASCKGVCLWVMEENGWTKEYENHSSFLYRFFYNHYAKGDQINNAIFFEKNGELLITGENKGLLSYNLTTRVHNRTCQDCVTYVDRYVESLLWTELLPTSQDNYKEPSVEANTRI